MIVRVTGFTAELDRAKLGSNSGHMSMADELDCASEELREFGDWSGSKEIHVDDGDEPGEDRVNEAVMGEFNITYLTVDHIDYDVIEPDDGGGKVQEEKEEVKDYDEECRHARMIAALSTEKLDGETAAKEIAEAVVMCKAHPVVCLGDGLISFDYDNSFGPTCDVDDVLERMNMRDWRMACDWFCKLMLRKGGLDPENFDWPTPLPKVMKVPEDEGTDVIARVCVTFKVDERTYKRILSVVDKKDEDTLATEEEICANCDHVIRYVPEKGKRVVTCPECGTINPLCNECNSDTKTCSECKISKMCEELNRQRADALPKPEEE